MMKQNLRKDGNLCVSKTLGKKVKKYTWKNKTVNWFFAILECNKKCKSAKF